MTHYHVDPSLPPVADTDVTCHGCGQTLATITENGLYMPDRHYPRPRHVRNIPGLVIGTEHNGYNGRRLCPVNADDLSTLIYRAQRAAAGLGPPQLHDTPVITLRGVA